MVPPRPMTPPLVLIRRPWKSNLVMYSLSTVRLSAWYLFHCRLRRCSRGCFSVCSDLIVFGFRNFVLHFFAARGAALVFPDSAHRTDMGRVI